MSFKFFLHYFFNVPIKKEKNLIKRIFFFFKALFLKRALKRLCQKTFLIPALKSGLLIEKNSQKIIAYDMRNSSLKERLEILKSKNSLVEKSFSRFKSKCFKKEKVPDCLISYLNKEKLTEIECLDYAMKQKNIKFLSYKSK